MKMLFVLFALLISTPSFAGLSGVYEYDEYYWYGEMTVVEYQRLNARGDIWVSWNTIVPGSGLPYECGQYDQLV